LTNFIQLSSNYCTLNPVDTTRLSFHGTTFAMWHFTINMKAIYLYVSDRSCQFLSKHPDIFTSLKLRSLSANLIQLSSTYCKLNPVHTTRLSFHGTNFPCGTSLLIGKLFIFMFQIGPANSYQNIRISSQV
jgi:hypothetical protein